MIGLKVSTSSFRPTVRTILSSSDCAVAAAVTPSAARIGRALRGRGASGSSRGGLPSGCGGSAIIAAARNAFQCGESPRGRRRVDRCRSAPTRPTPSRARPPHRPLRRRAGERDHGRSRRHGRARHGVARRAGTSRRARSRAHRGHGDRARRPPRASARSRGRRRCGSERRRRADELRRDRANGA